MGRKDEGKDEHLWSSASFPPLVKGGPGGVGPVASPAQTFPPLVNSDFAGMIN